jgi:hypothetical protein
MFREDIHNQEPMTKNILLLTECWVGAMAAGRFAARVLFDDNTKIIILNTFKSPERVNGSDQAINAILRQTAQKDIDTLSNYLISEHGIPSQYIEKRIAEGDLQTIIRNEFQHLSNLSVVLGQNLQNPFRKGSCSKIIKTLVAGNTRPIFLVSDFITLIESSRISLIAEREAQISNLYSNYLLDIYPDSDARVHIIPRDNSHEFEMGCGTAMHIARHARIDDLGANSPEHLFLDMAVRPDPC